jgi:hypothetical protein
MRYQTKISQEDNTPAVEAGESNPFLDSLNAEGDEALPEPSDPINVDSDTLLTEDASGTPEAIEATVLSSGAEVVTVSDRVGDIVDTVVGLESIYLQLQKIKDAEGNISVESYGFLTIAYEQSVRKFPALQKNSGLPSMEEFAMNADRANTISLESVGEKLVNGYNALVKFIKDLIERVKAFFGHIISATNVIVRKAKSLMERLKSVNDNATGSDISMPAVLNHPVLTDNNIGNLTGIVKSIGEASYRDVIDIYNNAITGNKEIPVSEVIGSMHKAFDAYGKMAGDVYLGNLSFSNDDFPPAIKLLDAEARKVKPYTKSKMKTYLEQNVKLGVAIFDLKSSQVERTRALTTMMAMMKDFADKQTKTDERSEFRKQFELMTAAVQFIRKLQTFENKVLSRAIQVANAINNSCAASISALEAHDKK